MEKGESKIGQKEIYNEREIKKRAHTLKCSLFQVGVVEVIQHRVLLMATPTTPDDFKTAHREAKSVENISSRSDRRKKKSMRVSVGRVCVSSRCACANVLTVLLTI